MSMFGYSAPVVRRPVTLSQMPWMNITAPQAPAPPPIPDMGQSGATGVGFGGSPQSAPQPAGPQPLQGGPQAQVPQMPKTPLTMTDFNMPSAATYPGQTPISAPQDPQGQSTLAGMLHGLSATDVSSLMNHLRTLAGNFGFGG